ncbi:MAG: hypothetical protein N6V41_01565, partial [Candidatus Portiera aleyrodidarum]|nr:hypothetical protein [Candidatus Portiera aleyrodidarum]
MRARKDKRLTSIGQQVVVVVVVVVVIARVFVTFEIDHWIVTNEKFEKLEGSRLVLLPISIFVFSN